MISRIGFLIPFNVLKFSCMILSISAIHSFFSLGVEALNACFFFSFIFTNSNVFSKSIARRRRRESVKEEEGIFGFSQFER